MSERPTEARLSRFWWALLAATAVAFVLRWIAVGHDSFWFDEAGSIKLSTRAATDLATGRAQDNGNPPLYFLLLKLWTSCFGTSEVGARSLSVLVGVAAVPLLGLLGRRLVGEAAGALAAGLLALSPFAIELSNEARTYSLTMLLGIADMLCFVRWRERRRIADLLALALFTFLACWSHVYAFAFPLAQAVCVAAWGRREGLVRGWVAAMALAACLWSTWLPSLLAQVARREPGSRDWLFQFLGTPVALTVGRSFAWSGSAPTLLALAVLLVVGLFAPVALLGFRVLRDLPFARVLLIGWLLIPFVPPLAFAPFGSPPYMVRHASVGLPALLLIVAAGLLAVAPELRRAALAAIVVACGFSIVRFSTLPFKDDWRSASGLLVEKARAEEAVVFDPDYELESFRYYARQRGASPPAMYGVMGGLGKEGELRGVRVNIDGVRAERRVRDWTREVVAPPVVWVVLCRPATTAEEWEAWMAAHGFRRAGVYPFHRVDVLRFER